MVCFDGPGRTRLVLFKELVEISLSHCEGLLQRIGKTTMGLLIFPLVCYDAKGFFFSSVFSCAGLFRRAVKG